MPPQNFTQVVNANTNWVLVTFYKQPNRAFPAFNNAAAQVKALGPNPPVLFAQVDSDQNPQLASTFNVTGTLALIWFLNGMPKPYAGISLKADDIAFWVTNQIDSITVSLTELVLTLSPQNMLGHNLKSDVPSSPSELQFNHHGQQVRASRVLRALVHRLQGILSRVPHRSSASEV